MLGFGGRATASDAAFVNGALAHALDFDDQTPWGQHAASSIVPAALALAERVGGVSGGTLIAAVAVGQDLFARLRRHVGWRKDWNLSSVLGVYAATVASGRVLGLPAGSHRARAGHREHALERSDEHGGRHGERSARHVRRVLGAGRGRPRLCWPSRASPASRSCSRESHGVLATYFRGEYDRDAILATSARIFRGAGTLYKLWPSVGTSHSHIHATLQLMERARRSRPTTSSRCGCTWATTTPSCADRSPTEGSGIGRRREVQPAVPGRSGGGPGRSGPATTSPREALATRPSSRWHSGSQPVPDADLDWKDVLPPGRVEIRTRDGRTATRVGTGVPGNSAEPADMGSARGEVLELRSTLGDRGGRRARRAGHRCG